jgi:N-acetylmuramic acid 6-phosphate etherase
VATPEALPTTEGVDPRYQDIDDWPTQLAVAALWEAQLSAVAAAHAALPAIAAAAEAAAARLRGGGRLIYCGAGTSGRLAAQDGAELPPTFGWPDERIVLLLAGGVRALSEAVEGAEDDTAAAEDAVRRCQVGRADVCIAVAASGRTAFTRAALQTARDAGALTIAVANSQQAPLLALADHAILVATGAEPIAGSTRLKAGTAQKVALNLVSTAVMLRLGRVHRGLMVDLRPSNTKLRDRAVRILQALTGAEADRARDALGRADGHVKTAVLLLRGLTPDAAASLLGQHEGQLRDALRALEHD